MSYADLDGVPSQTAGVSSLLGSDWNTYVRDNFDSIKFGHVVVADNTAKSAISAVEGIMVYQSNVDTLFLYNGTAWVEAVGTLSLVDSAVTSAKIANDTIVNADINTAAAIAYSKLNLASSVTSADIVDSTIVIGDLAAALQAFLVPTGTVSAFAGSSAPTGYLLCDGVATHSTTTYAALFAVVGYTYGGSGGVFGVPNLKGRTVIGVGVGTEITGVLGTVQGVKEVTLTGAESGTSAHSHPTSTTSGGSSHSHTYSGTTASSDWNAYYNHYSTAGGSAAVPVSTSEGDGRTYQGAGGGHQHTFSGTTDGESAHTHTYTITAATAAAAASAHTNIQPSLPLNYIIKI